MIYFDDKERIQNMNYEFINIDFISFLNMNRYMKNTMILDTMRSYIFMLKIIRFLNLVQLSM